MSARRPIIYVSPYYDPSIASGANRRFDEICRRLLADYGDDFTLVVAKGKKPAWWNGKNLIEIDYGFNHFSKPIAMWQITRALNAAPPSIVIMESLPLPFFALKRHTHFQCAYDFRYFHSFSKSRLYRLLFSRYLKYEWGRCQYIVTPSEFSISELERFVGFPREHVVKSFFGINEKIFDVPKDTPKEYDIIYVGHFDGHKNHAPLIDALALMDKNLKVLFAGVDNGLQKSLEARAAAHGLTNITFTRILKEENVWKAYTQSRLFVSPAIYEGFGMPTIEALALGLPVALSDIPVFREVAGDIAVYFDPHNPEDIAIQLRAALANPTPPDQKRVKKLLAPYLWEEIYKQFVADLQRLSD